MSLARSEARYESCRSYHTGVQRQRGNEAWFLKGDRGAGFRRVGGIDQLFFKQDTNSAVTIMIAKVTDDVLIVGRRIDLEELVELLGKCVSRLSNQ